MRDSFFKTLTDLARGRKDLFLLTGDLGYRLFDEFRSQNGERFFDTGVAESNMVGIASGLALAGKNVYCYSIIPFLVMRAYEQIRVDVAYHNLNVKLIGAGGGFTYGLEGFTHWGLEDMALMRALPNMTVVSPCDIYEATKLAELSCDYPGPLYIRLDRPRVRHIHNGEPEFRIGKGIPLKMGKGVAFLALGNMVHTALEVSRMLLERDGIEATVVSMHTVKPFDKALLSEIAQSHSAIFSLEEHYAEGGLGSTIAELLFDMGYKGRFGRVGIPDRVDRCIGSVEHLREMYGLTPEHVYQRVVAES